MKKVKNKIVSLTLVVSMIVASFSTGVDKKQTIIHATTTTDPVLQLWYDEPALDWESEALPIGNGKLAAMVFGGVDSDKIQCNEETIWSGGPGASTSYDGGSNSTTTADVHLALQNVRNSLQTMVSDFTKNKAAHYDASGKLITSDYTDLTSDATFTANLNKLKGEKDNFGSYQTLGNIYLIDPAYQNAKISNITTNANPSNNESETVNALFDADSGTKWFTGFGLNKTATIQWKYDKSIKTKSYTLISGNDEQGRDPRDWKLYGSTDGTNFTEIDSKTGVTFAERKESKTFSLSSEVDYTYYKLEITANKNGDNGCFQLTDLIIDGAKSQSSTYENYKRMTDVNRAVEKVSYTQNGINYNREYFMSNPANIMAIRLTSDQKGKVTKNIQIDSEQKNKAINSIAGVTSGAITMQGQPSGHTTNGEKFAQQIEIVPDGGTISKVDENTISVKDADSVTIYMSAATNYKVDSGTTYNYFNTSVNPADVAKNNVDNAIVKGYDTLYTEHVNDYTNLFDRVKFNIGAVDVPTKTTDKLLADYQVDNTEMEDKYLETLFYQYGRYLMIASSRENSQMPANLQGKWAQGLSPMWNSDYHTNINLQMNYWLAEQTNLAECHTPVINYINSMVKKGEVTAKKYFCKQDGSDVRGWVINHENNIWGNTNPGETTTAFYFPAAAAWMCQDIWDTYQFNNDKTFLQNNYDTLLGAALFWVDNLWKDSRDGSLVANPSYSPEHGAYSLGCTSDQALIWEVFEEVKQASEVLNKQDDAQVKEVLAAQEKLYMPKPNTLGGQLPEWKDETTLEVTNADSHRHQNNLSILHPGTFVIAGRSDLDNQYVNASKVTLNKRGDGGTGWSKAWKINMWARLRDGNRAKKLLGEQIKGSTLKNLFDTHAPFQIDGNFGATSGVTEMLLQSQGDYIEPLAALPSAWQTGSITGLKARDNFTISMNWDNGIAADIDITSNSGNECKVKYAKLSESKLINKATGEEVKFNVIDNNTVSFATQKGATYSFVNMATDIKVSSQKKFIGGIIDNIYNSEIQTKLGVSSDDGVYFESFKGCSYAESIGLQVNDVIVSMNDEPITNANSLIEQYDKLSVGDKVQIRVMRKDKEVNFTFVKSSNDEARKLPGKIQAEEAEQYVGALHTEACGDEGGTENVGYINTGDYAVYKSVDFTSKVDKFIVRAAAFNGVTPAVSVRLDSLDGIEIANIKLKNTNAYQVYATNECTLKNLDNVTGLHTLYLVFETNMNINWFSFASTQPESTPNPVSTEKPAPTFTPIATVKPTESPQVTVKPSQTNIPYVTPKPTSIVKVKNVTVTKVKRSKQLVKIQWKKVKDVSGYEVQIATKSNYKNRKSYITKKVGYTIARLDKKKKYYVRVHAYKLQAKKKIYGKFSKSYKI